MAAIFVEPDPFQGKAADVAAYIPRYRGGKYTQDEKNVRDPTYFKQQTEASVAELSAVSRPLNGIQAKPNTPAFVQVVRADGKIVKVFNALGSGLHTENSGDYYDGGDELNIQRQNPDKSAAKKYKEERDRRAKKLEEMVAGRFGWAPWGVKTLEKGDVGGGDGAGLWDTGVDELGKPTSSYWTDWLLQTVREQRMEKTQVVETFGDTYVYAMGEKPRALIFQGLLMNTSDYNWRATFWENWDKYFRATQLIQMKARVFIGWDDIVVEGYPINAMCTEQADSPNAMSFSFTFFVTNYHNMTARTGWSQTKLTQSKIAMMRTGQNAGYNAHQNVQQIYDTRWSLFDKMGGVGASRGIGNMFADGTKNIGHFQLKDGTGERVYLSEWDKYVVKNSQQAMRLITSAPFKLTNFQPGHIVSWLSSELQRLTFNTLNMGHRLIIEQERKLGYKDGEFNGWYGALSTIVDNIATSAGVGRWDGDLENNAGLLVGDLIGRHGSLSRLVQRMGYQLNGLLGDAIGAGVYRTGPKNRFGKSLLEAGSDELFKYAGADVPSWLDDSVLGYKVANADGTGFDSAYRYDPGSYAALFQGKIKTGFEFDFSGNAALGYSNNVAGSDSYLLWGAHNYQLTPDATLDVISLNRDTQKGLMVTPDVEE